MASDDDATTPTPSHFTDGSAHRRPLAIATLLLFVAAAWVASPLWVGLMLGAVMAFSAQPVQRCLTERFRVRNGIAAATTTLLGGIAMACGGVALVYLLARQVVQIVGVLQRSLSSDSPRDLLGTRAAEAVYRLGIDPAAVAARVHAELARLSNGAAAAAGVVFQTTTWALLTLIIALWTMYYTLLDWPHLAERLERLLPFDPSDVRALTLEFIHVGRSAFVGTIGCAIVQGVLAWSAFAVAGVPQAGTWSVLLSMASLIPVVGTSVVWFPVGVYLIASGRVAWGIFEWAWGLLVVMALSDYVVRPRLVGKRGDTHPLLTLVSLVGGVLTIGLPGLVAGPLIVSLFAATARIYERHAAPSSSAFNSYGK
jgi:predicted PurR-regulated permease PerM